jgi:urease accessory protein
MSLKRSILTATFVLATAPAFAHAGAASHSHFASGFLHPMGGLDHMLAMVTVGLFASLLGGRAVWALPMAFVGMMLVGGSLGVVGIEIPAVEAGISASIVILGAVVALGCSWSLATAMALTGLFAIAHGYAHGAEMPADANALTYSIGFALATALLHGAGLLAGLAASGRRHILRVAGGAVAVAGVVLALV